MIKFLTNVGSLIKNSPLDIEHELEAVYSDMTVLLPEFVLTAANEAFGDINDSCNWFTFYITSANLNQLIRKLKNASYEEKVEYVLEILVKGSKRQRGSLRKMIKLLKNIGSLIKDSPLDNTALIEI